MTGQRGPVVADAVMVTLAALCAVSIILALAIGGAR